MILATPNYHGTLSGVLKNALDLMSVQEFDGKVVGLDRCLGWTNGRRTSTLNALRAIGRTLHACVIPSEACVYDAATAFAADGSLGDAAIEERLKDVGRKVAPDPHACIKGSARTPSAVGRGGRMATTEETGPWDVAAFDKLVSWAPATGAAVEKITTIRGPERWTAKPWNSFALRLTRRANLNEDGTRLHIRKALAAGATRDDLLTVLMMASLLSIHTCSLGAPILLEEAKNAGVTATEKNVTAYRGCDRMRARRTMERFTHGIRSTLSDLGMDRQP